MRSPDVLGVGLGVAAAQRRHGVGVLPPDPVEHLPGLLIADGSDGAAVDDVGVRLLGKGHHLMAPGPEGLLDGLGLVLIHFAPQGIDGNFHGYSLRFPKILIIMYRYVYYTSIFAVGQPPTAGGLSP